MIFICLLFISIYGKNQNNKSSIGIKGSLISLCVFAIFSYPLHIPALFVLWILLEGFLLFKSLYDKNSYLFRIIIFIIFSLGSLKCIKEYSIHKNRIPAVEKWMLAKKIYYTGDYNSIIKTYNELYPLLEWNDDFCFEYSRVLFKLGQTNKAEKILTKLLDNNGNPMILNLLGEISQKNKQYVKAEQYFIRSCNRLPNRIYPYYLLVKLYNEENFYDKIKLINAANQVLSTSPKVYSIAIKEMHQDVKNILKKRDILMYVP